MDYDTLNRRRQRLEKKRLNLVRFSGQTNPFCAACGFGDDRCLYFDKNINSVTCRNCSLKRLGLTDEARATRLKCFAGLGYPNPQCVVCAEENICVIEEHHFFGESNSKLSGPLCSNCHAIQSDMQMDFSVDVRTRDPQRRSLIYQAAFLFGIFILFTVLGIREKGGDNSSLGLALVSIGAMALAWAYWNLSADDHFARKFGDDYDKDVPLARPS